MTSESLKRVAPLVPLVSGWRRGRRIGRLAVSMLTGIAAAVLFLPTSSWAQGSPVYVEPSVTLLRQTMSVKPGQYVYYKLPLERGVTLVTEFHVRGGLNNRVNVWLLDLANFQRYSAKQTFSYFKGTSGTIQEVARYKFVIPQTDVYHLVLDNTRSVVFARNVRQYAYALSPTGTPESAKLQQGLEQVYQGLKRLFVFRDFRLIVRHCGIANAFSDPNIHLCIELVEQLADQQVSQALGFVIFHELGHTLLRLWDYPLAENEDVADEFATVFLMMTKQQNIALQAAQWWSSQTSEKEAVAKLWINDRHTLSPQRARNIIAWLNRKDDLLHKWQKILVPNLQTEALRSLDREAERWVDHSVVRAELERRAAQQ